MSDDLIKRSDVLSMIDAFERDFQQSWRVQFSADIRALPAVNLSERIEQLERERDGAYLERNQLVALLASVYPSGIKRTAIEGWHEDWHGCIYIDFPWGQASWHYHESQADLFSHLPPYEGQWDGHSTEAKYTAIVEASRAVLAELEGKECVTILGRGPKKCTCCTHLSKVLVIG